MKIEPITVPVNIELHLDPSVLAKTMGDDAVDVSNLDYGCFVKAQEEHRYSLGLAYPALRPDAKRGADGRRDVVRPEVLQKAAWSWMTKSASSGLYHFNGAGGGSPVDGCCTVVESYLWPADDWVLKAADGTEVTIRNGDWLVGAIWDADTWPLVKSLQVAGWSPEGTAVRQAATPHLLAELRST